VLALIRRAMRRARDELGVVLRTEVQLVGDFGEAPEGSGEPRRPEGSGEPRGGAPVGRVPVNRAEGSG